MKKIFIFTVLVIVIVVLLLSARTPKNGAADFKLYDMTDNLIKLSDYEGKPVILFFWATWCPSCRGEIAELNNLYPELKKAGIEVLAIDLQEKKKVIRSFLKAHPVGFRVLRDIDGDVAYSYGIIGIPTYILINKKGKEYHRNTLPKSYKELLLGG